VLWGVSTGDSVMMGRQAGDQSQLLYSFNLEERIPARHLLRRINPIMTRVLAHRRLGDFTCESVGVTEIEGEVGG